MKPSEKIEKRTKEITIQDIKEMLPETLESYYKNTQVKQLVYLFNRINATIEHLDEEEEKKVCCNCQDKEPSIGETGVW